MKNRLVTLAAVAGFLATFLVPSALAQITWNGSLASGTYDYNTGANWIGGVAPTGSAASQFMSTNNGTSSNAYTINTSAGVGTTSGNELRSITVAKSNGTVVLNVGHAFNIIGNLASSLADVGGTLNINSGGNMTYGFFNGTLTQATANAQILRGGVVNVNNGGLLTFNGNSTTSFIIGTSSGTSSLNVASGGTLDVKSGLFRIGYTTAAGSATGNLTSSGTVTSAIGLRVGEQSLGTPTGIVNVNAGNFTVSAGSTFGVSANGTGTLNIAGGNGGIRKIV